MKGPKDIPGLSGAVMLQVYDHIFENADREVGGVLVGHTGRKGGVPLVTAAIPAINAGERRATLTFTQDAWEHVHRVIEADHPNDQIVGWYHSHPGFGIFLSEHDLFIHRNFFSGASQIALVVDPLEGSEGVFGWADGEIVPWYVTASLRPGLQPGAGAAIGAPPGESPARAAGPGPRALGAALAVGFLLGVALWEGVLRDGGGQPAAAPPAATAPATTTRPPVTTTTKTKTTAKTPAARTTTGTATTVPATTPAGTTTTPAAPATTAPAAATAPATVPATTPATAPAGTTAAPAAATAPAATTTARSPATTAATTTAPAAAPSTTTGR